MNISNTQPKQIKGVQVAEQLYNEEDKYIKKKKEKKKMICDFKT